MPFSPRAGDATISKKSHHHRKQEIARVAAALSSDIKMRVYFTVLHIFLMVLTERLCSNIRTFLC